MKCLTGALDGIFERAAIQKSIIIDREPLRSDYLPKTLPNRESYIKRIGHLWSPVLRTGRSSAREKPTNLLIFGMSGTGKTATVKYVKEKLLGKLKTMKNAPKVRVNLVNVRMSGSVYGTIQQLCRDNNIKAPKGHSTSGLLDKFKKAISKTDAVFIIILDEIDYIVEAKSFLYSMLRINEYLSDMGSNARCSIVGITNSLSFKDVLDPGTLSSLGHQEMLFHPYDADALRTIVEDRVKIAFAPNTVDEEAIALISALSAGRGGDARWAIDILRAAGELADMDGAVKITADSVKEAKKRLTEGRVRDAIINLSLHQQIILVAIVKDFQERTQLLHRSKKQVTRTYRIEAPSLYEKYVETCNRYAYGLDPISYRRFHQLVNELDTAGILLTRTVYHGSGRVKKIALAETVNLLKDTLSLKPVLAEFFK